MIDIYMEIGMRELVISEELRKKVDMIYKFSCVKYQITNGSIINIKSTNIAYVKPHILKVNSNDYFNLILILFVIYR